VFKFSVEKYRFLEREKIPNFAVCKSKKKKFLLESKEKEKKVATCFAV
jgi:hypothetical protein